MTANVSFNPYLQTVGNNGLFNVSADGLRQGTAYPDPSTRWRLRTGVLDSTETLPMWGGVGIYENVPGVSGGPNVNLGVTVGRADSLTGSKALAGFSVFDQAYGMVTSPQSTVPLIGSYGQVMNYPLGSLARIAVKCDATLIDLAGGAIGAQVSWDFVAQMLIPYSATYAADTITNAVWANTNGGQVTFTVSSDLTADINAGDVIETSGVVSTAAAGVYNGQFTVVSITSTTIVVAYLAAASPGTYSSGGSVTAGGGALPVKVLEVRNTNCETVTYDPTTGFATWDYNGAAAVIMI